MAKSLVIVESPAKAKTINKYLGKEFEVEASLGHVKDLPKSGLSVDVDNDFATELAIIPGKEKVMAKLKKMAAKAVAVYLAPDPDREGEAIAAHLAEEFGVTRDSKKKLAIPVYRVTFNEITQRAVKEAFEHARGIDWNLVDAQQARRVLDRLVGYKISPLLWDKVKRGLSAGRVQTVALRFIVEREREIRAFTKQEYWSIDAALAGKTPPVFDAAFSGKNGDKYDKLQIGDEASATAITSALEKADWRVSNVEKREQQRRPVPPFTTSKFQQDASRKLSLPVKVAMGIAQKLYMGVELGDEGSVGLITYMRTDSTRVGKEALDEVREHIGKEYGKEFLPESPNTFKSKKDTQDAHEAIRPTSVEKDPESVRQYLQPNEYKVYKLIWQRFVASQMMPAIFDRTTIEIDAKADKDTYQFRATGSIMKFAGFLKVYEETKESKDEDDEALEHKLPPVETGDALKLEVLKPEQHFTEPPPRYNEASLVKELEERGVGRPSTYAAIISSIQERGYVVKHERRFSPTETGEIVATLLVDNFEDIFDPNYTAGLEEELDEIEEGREKWTKTMASFYKKLSKDISYAEKNMVNIKTMKKPTGEMCERCGSPLIERWGRHGWFYACSSYDKKKKGSCDFTKEKPDKELAVDEDLLDDMCENCGQPMVLKRGRFGQFLACTGYPTCRTTRRLDQNKKVPDVPLEEKCPKCERTMVLRHGQYGEFTSCSGYPECKYIKQNYIGVKCPDCKDGDIAEKKARRGNYFYGCSNYPDCEFTSNYKPIAEKCPQCDSPYLLEKTLKSGTVIVCPNNKKTSEEEEKPKRRKKKGKAEAEEPAKMIQCDYTRAAELEPATTNA
ncbi:MAG: topoisomerase [Acidobacteriales bacterium]|nr:topoisomerase [Terriglobales bacterium]